MIEILDKVSIDICIAIFYIFKTSLIACKIDNIICEIWALDSKTNLDQQTWNKTHVKNIFSFKSSLLNVSVFTVLDFESNQTKLFRVFVETWDPKSIWLFCQQHEKIDFISLLVNTKWKKYEAVSIHLTHRMTLSKLIHFNLVKKCLVRTLMMPCSQYNTVENYDIFCKIDTNLLLLNDNNTHWAGHG